MNRMDCESNERFATCIKEEQMSYGNGEMHHQGILKLF